MAISTTVTHIGHYCGRFQPGWWGEPQNSLSNAAFVVGALLALRIWRRRPDRDPWQLPLFVLAGAIGVGSFVFHSHPDPATLLIDLVPIQLFGLAAIAYVLLRVLRLSPLATGGFLLAFFVARQAWLQALPPLWGGGITHLPALLVLLGLGVVLKRRGAALASWLLPACLAYAAALGVRAWDLPLCARFPLGLHWAWHLLTAAAASLIACGLAAQGPGRLLASGSRRLRAQPR